MFAINKTISQIDSILFKEQILLLDGDVFVQEPVKVLKKVERFLELPSFFTEDHFDYTGRYLTKLLEFDFIIFGNIVGKHGFPCFKLDADSMSKCMSDSKARDHPELSQESLKLLRSKFRPMLEKFKEQTGMSVNLS